MRRTVQLRPATATPAPTASRNIASDFSSFTKTGNAFNESGRRGICYPFLSFPLYGVLFSSSPVRSGRNWDEEKEKEGGFEGLGFLLFG